LSSSLFSSFCFCRADFVHCFRSVQSISFWFARSWFDLVWAGFCRRRSQFRIFVSCSRTREAASFIPSLWFHVASSSVLFLSCMEWLTWFSAQLHSPRRELSVCRAPVILLAPLDSFHLHLVDSSCSISTGLQFAIRFPKLISSAQAAPDADLFSVSISGWIFFILR
jgi:hypothetical protein